MRGDLPITRPFVASPSPSDPAPLFSLRGIRKSFPGILANDNIDLDISSSEIHALVGENGAGKSTLVKILYGFYRADTGRILLSGKEVRIHSPHDARALRIGMVFQEFSLIPAFSVAENIALFLADLQPVMDLGALHRRIHHLSERYGLQVNPQAPASQLSVGELQKVEILKLLLSDARLLILDEPTRVLAPHEVDSLFRVLERLREEGFAILLITHKLKEVMECASRITVLRGGRVVGSLPRSQAREDQLVAMMFGKELSRLERPRKIVGGEAAAPLLELRGVETRAEGVGTSLKAMDLSIFPGEIVGVAGVSGNGQRELGDVILGVEKCVRGSRLLFGVDASRASARHARKGGVAFIPESPLGMALVPFMTVLENMALTRPWHYARLGGLAMDWQAVTADAEETGRRLGFPLSLTVPARSMSGGNQQRVVIVREMTHKPRLIIASYLTRGLDAASTVAARQCLIQARDEGAGVLLISEDLEELFELSDRLVALYGGRIVGTFRPDETNAHDIGRLMTGSGMSDGASI